MPGPVGQSVNRLAYVRRKPGVIVNEPNAEYSASTGEIPQRVALSARGELSKARGSCPRLSFRLAQVLP